MNSPCQHAAYRTTWRAADKEIVMWRFFIDEIQSILDAIERPL